MTAYRDDHGPAWHIGRAIHAAARMRPFTHPAPWSGSGGLMQQFAQTLVMFKADTTRLRSRVVAVDDVGAEEHW